MDMHTLLGGLAILCLTLGTFTILMILASYLEHKARVRLGKENSPTNFDIEN